MGVLTRDRFLRSFLAVFLTATLVVSMVPTPALAAVASRGLDGAVGVAQGQPSSEESSPQGETVGAVSPSTPADPSKPDEAWGQGAGSAWWAGAAEDGSVGTSSSSRDGTTNDPLGESVPEESYADALERSVIEGTDLLSAALSSAPHDANNPHTKVEVGKYAPGTYTVTANLFIPASRNPFNGTIQTYMTNPENPLGIVEPDNGDPSAVTGGVPTFHVEKNATLTVGEDDSLTLTVPIRNPVFTLQGIGSGQGVEVVSAHTRAGEYGPRDASGKVTIAGHTSRVDSITFRLSDSGKTTDGSDGYTIQRCSEYPTTLNQNWHADLDLTVDLSNVPASQKYVSDPTVAENLTYNGHEQQGVTFETDKCDVISGAAAATNAGDYSLTLKPKNGLTWLDGTTNARSLDWKIAEAQGVKKYETVAPCPEDASKTIAAQPLADAVNAGFPYEGLIGSHVPELLGITSQTSDAWNPGTFGHAQLMSEPRVLEPGTYTVTANISMMTPLGFPGYTTNPFNPEGIGGKGGIPNTPVSNNATLTVGADGSRMLSLNLVNPVFTVQNAESSKGVTVEATDRVPIEQKGDDEEYNKAVAADGITSRIAHMTLRLNDWSGSYHFDNWKVYATTLSTFFPNNKYPQIKSLDLSVDISHAQKQVEGDYSKTFTDKATGVSVTVSAEKGTSVIPQLEKASLQVEKIESGMEHDGAKQALTQLYTSAPGFFLYRVLLIADGKPISLDDKTSAEVSIPAARPDAAVYSFRTALLSAVESRMSSGKILFKPSQLGSFVVVDSQGVAKFSWSHTVRDASTGASMTYSTDASVEDTLFESAYGPGKGLESLEWYASYMDASGVSSSQAPSSFSEKALSAAKESGSGGWTIAGAYAMGISYSMDGSGVPNNLFDSLSLGYTFTAGINPLSAIVPVASGNASVYAVYGTVGAGATGVKKLSAQITDGYAKVSLNDSDAQIPGLSSMLFHAAAGVGDYTGAPQTAETQIAYLMVVEPSTQKIGEPSVARGLTYSGREQVGVPAGEGYEVSGGAAAAAGDYEATATPRDGYAWADGSTAPRAYRWSIARAPLTAAYAGEEVAEGEAPALRVDVTGFVGGEGPSTAAGYRAPAVSAPSPLAAGSYELAPSGGAADNYEFAYVGGTLAVRPGGLPRPDSLAPGTYAVTANLAMPGQYNPVISGLTVYANSPNNPFGPTIDENDPAEVKNEIPSSPLSMNARVVVGADGARTLVLPIKNPIFTTQELGTCEGLSDVRTERVRPTAAGGDWSGSYNRRPDRIHMMSARLPGGAATGVAEFAFRGSVLYAVPLDRELRPSGDVALRLTVDYSSLRRDSDSTELPAFAKGDAPRPDPRPGPDNPNKPNNPSNPNPSPDKPNNPNPSPNNPNPSPNNPSNPIPVPNSGKGSGGGISPKDSGDAIRTSNGHLAAGTYTVSANIWVNKATSGLPLQPHFTSAAFPPMNPVSKNATLRVESDGHAYVTVPIVIQSRVMHVLSLTGLDIVRQSYSGEGLSSITVDLGVLRNTDTITKNVTARIRLGSLAKTIIGGNENRTWACTFQVVFNGTSASGGGTIPKAAQDIINAQGKDGRAANSDERARSAADAAMAALDADDGGAAGEDAPAAGSSSAQTTRGRSKGTAEQAAQAAEQLAQGNAGLVAGMVALGIVALGAVAYALHLRRRLKGMGSPPPSPPPSGEA